jgi:hypothetical protein
LVEHACEPYNQYRNWITAATVIGGSIDSSASSQARYVLVSTQCISDAASACQLVLGAIRCPILCSSASTDEVSTKSQVSECLGWYGVRSTSTENCSIAVPVQLIKPGDSVRSQYEAFYRILTALLRDYLSSGCLGTSTFRRCFSYPTPDLPSLWDQPYMLRSLSYDSRSQFQESAHALACSYCAHTARRYDSSDRLLARLRSLSCQTKPG